MSFLVLVRHGQSIWNLEKRFTGWVDVDLTDQGKIEAEKAGLLIKNQNIDIDFYYSSFQLRANNTLKIIQKILKTKKPMDGMSSGEVLKMTSTDPGSQNDITAWANRTGNELLSAGDNGGDFVYYIKKS